ncbi:MAG: Hsp20/alpha crystallin family protein [archaeon]|nr:MAG: Hsp20/alpha crystallin family protein [archaeon]
MRRRRPFRFFWEDENWNPWEEFDNIRSGIPVDLSETEGSIIVKANMPGIDKQNVSLRIVDNRLVIEGEQSEEEREEKKNYFRQERRYGNFHREISLPVEVEEDSTKAEMKDGVLMVELPKKEKGRKKGKELKIS